MSGNSPSPKLHLALEVDGDGAHPAAWRASGRRPAAVLDPTSLRQVVARAESAGFTFVTFEDSPLPPSDGLDAVGRLEAGSRAAYVSRLTDRIGLAPTLHVTTTEPFHLATQLASLDHATVGRAGWVVGAVNTADAMATIGAAPLDEAGFRREVRDVVEVARLLWDSWEDGAAIREVASGRFLDPDLVHHVDFEGGSFSVKGPLITPRPPQGQVVVIAPSRLWIDDLADIVLVDGPEPEAAVAHAGRAGGPLVFVDIEVALDTEVPAGDRLAVLDAATPWGHSGRIRHVGSADGLVELVRSLAGRVDGVRFHPAVHAVDLTEIIVSVLPPLHRAGLLEPPVRGATLRQTLHLPRPANHFARIPEEAHP